MHQPECTRAKVEGMTQSLEIFTVGHSTRSQEELIDLLQQNGIRVLADIRRFPSSRRHPWFGGPELAAALSAVGIRYQHIPALGGHRHRPGEISPNPAWRSAGFRAYADYMLTEPFGSALDQLIALARGSRLSVMCAEAVPYRCHRMLVSDALAARSVRVVHILGTGHTEPHRLTAFARVDGWRVTYP